MKDRLTDEERRCLIAYRQEQAQEELAVARENLSNERYRAAVNRAYYACFYTALALLAQEGIDTKTHSGVKSMLGLHFVRTGRLPVRVQRIYSVLMDSRGEGDYDDFVYFDHNDAAEHIAMAAEFMEKVNSIININS